MNMVYVYALPLSEVAKYETIAHAAADYAVLPPCGGLALGDDRNLLLQRRRHLHALRSARLSRHGAGWRLLSAAWRSSIRNGGHPPSA